MSLLPTVQITLKQGLSTDEFEETFENIKKVPGIMDAFSASSKPDTVLSNYAGGDKTLSEVRKVPNVINVQDAPHRL